MTISYHSPRFLVLGISLALACCGPRVASESARPNSSVQQDIGAPLAVFAPAALPRPASVPPADAGFAMSVDTRPSIGIAGLAQPAAASGNAGRGRDFAFDNCRPCHVVAPNQTSKTRFSNAPDFRSIADAPTTTSLSLIVWLTNPHPTMPSLILSPQEAADVIAYIQSLRDRG
jgi:mono/diheme cytochrome c family protein